ncbi:uncharacterized protein EV420DRAFT_904791 [Desarmillaria tabescens]|uniref:Small EDRK-rich factor-like N-terminal domain-containing protein n=1 Tax=Armillaria tabescens TaxID=1929756 RepID=A0AA39JR66_ARMTA|nr:uncharacterized protein EV420DRAFT_904791 [Desarmillaria tabescens]KAK0446475.1 hypothetical protein EV420DRAFT_904791 [Desarmillaria tabescens]
MTRGNQRETDRAKAQKKAAAAAKKPKESASSLAKRKERQAFLNPLIIGMCTKSPLVTPRFFVLNRRKRKKSEPQRLQGAANDCGSSKNVDYIWTWV